MSSGIGRRLAAGVAVTAALAGGTVVSATPAAADVLPITVFGSLDAGSTVDPDNMGVGTFVDYLILSWAVCPAVVAGSTDADVPDVLTICTPSTGGAGQG